MTLRRLTIALSAFLLIAAILTGLWIRHARRQPAASAALLPPIVITIPKIPDDNGYDNLLRATELYVDTGVDLSTKPGVPITDAQQAALEANAPALAEMRRGLAKECVVPIASIVTLEASSAGSTLREFARLLWIESGLHRDDGRFGDALAPLADGLRLGFKLQVGGGVMERFNGHAIQSMMMARCQRLAGSRELAEVDLISTLRLLAEIEAMAPPIGQTLEAECRMMAAWGSGKHSRPAARLLGLTPEEKAAATRTQRDPLIRLSQKSFREVQAAAATPRPDRPSLWPREAVAERAAASWARIIATDFQLRSGRRGTQLLLAIELYSIRHGELPRSLTDLETLQVPDVKLSITDPLTDRPYIYRLEDGDYVLYSVGKDLIDDGGTRHGYSADGREDIIFHKPTADPTESDLP